MRTGSAICGLPGAVENHSWDDDTKSSTWQHGAAGKYIPDAFPHRKNPIPILPSGDICQPWEDENKLSTAQRCSLLLKRAIADREEIITELSKKEHSIYLESGSGEWGDRALTNLERHSFRSALVSLRNAQGHLNHFEPSRIWVGGTPPTDPEYHRGAEIATAMTSEAAHSTSRRCKELLNIPTTKRDEWNQELKKLSCTSDSMEVYPSELRSLETQMAMWGIVDLTRNDRICLQEALTALKDAQGYLSFFEPGHELDGNWDEAYEILNERYDRSKGQDTTSQSSAIGGNAPVNASHSDREQVWRMSNKLWSGPYR